MPNNKFIKAKVVSIDPYDSSQELLCQDGNTIWLAGLDRIPALKVGDEGVLVYFSTPSRGYYQFIPDKPRVDIE